MNIKSLTLKNKLSIEKTGEQYFDLTAPSFKYRRELGVKALHYVTQDQVGRIDKISEKYFGTGQYIDAICVINNIFNPFSVNEGDILAIPQLKNENLVYKRPNPASRPSATLAQYVNTEQQSEIDQSRIQRLIQKAKTKKTGVKAPIPPNMLQQGQAAKVFEGGKIKLGANLPTRNSTNTES
jgi:hypothetical protein|tara:strand:+ start:2457 stop:3002 length:546 start_codon:yes stop_codon:yes gene_type:complete